jgi:hypothetical protein
MKAEVRVEGAHRPYHLSGAGDHRLPQPRCRLKREFDRTLSFGGGGVDTQHFLPQASLEAIETEVRHTRLNSVYTTALKYR